MTYVQFEKSYQYYVLVVIRLCCLIIDSAVIAKIIFLAYRVLFFCSLYLLLAYILNILLSKIGPKCLKSIIWSKKSIKLSI
uniref:Ovule protein n=1 Tax=Heterorhabditis bacteriophora TaxID=37862 RepID=A0A1I7WCK5_HETBA